MSFTLVNDGMLAPPDVVQPPERTQAPHGLMGTALEVKEPKTQRNGKQVEGWAAGFAFQPEKCTEGGVWVPCIDEKTDSLNPEGSGSGSGEQLKSLRDAPDEILFVPYTIEAEFTCTTKGFSEAEYVRKAQRSLELVQEKRMEHEFWTGAQMSEHPTGQNNQSLVLSAETVLNDGTLANPTPVSPKVALAMLVQGIADCAGAARGVIHARPYLGELWANTDMIREEGSKLVTKSRGNWVVSGAGYPGTGPIAVGEAQGGAQGEPAQPAANETWVFATGPVNWRAGDVRTNPGEDEIGEVIAQAMHPRNNGSAHGWNNQVTFRAERPAAAVFDDCCVFAVLVDLSLCGC